MHQMCIRDSSWRISGDINAHWGSLRYVVGKNLYLSAYAGNGHYNDMDMMAVSYTHLDVYKRQPPFSVPFLGTGPTNAFEVLSFWA